MARHAPSTGGSVSTCPQHNHRPGDRHVCPVFNSEAGPQDEPNDECYRCRAPFLNVGASCNNLDTKRSVLRQFGDAVSICTPCGEDLLRLFTLWVDEGTPAKCRCGCYDVLKHVTRCEQRFITDDRPGMLKYWHTQANDGRSAISACSHPNHADFVRETRY